MICTLNVCRSLSLELLIGFSHCPPYISYWISLLISDLGLFQAEQAFEDVVQQLGRRISLDSCGSFFLALLSLFIPCLNWQYFLATHLCRIFIKTNLSLFALIFHPHVEYRYSNKCGRCKLVWEQTPQILGIRAVCLSSGCYNNTID